MKRIAFTVSVISLAAVPLKASDWSQAAANPARTSHVADEPKDPYKLAWRKCFGKEIVLNTCQPIMSGGVLFVGSENGIVHAVRLEDGSDIWSSDIGAPVMHALACDEERVYAAAFDGAIHALDKASGKEAWKAPLSRRGFSAAPLLMDGTLYIGSRDGVFYAVRADTGKPLWKTGTGDPIVHTAAGAEGKIVFVNESMRALCLDANSGRVLWKTDPLPGRSVRDYWPVIHKGRVVIRTAEAGERVLSGHPTELQKRLFWPITYGKVPDNAKMLFRAKNPDDIVKEQDIFVAYFKEHPYARTFFVLNLRDGREPYTASIVTGCRNTGVPPPPCLAGDGHLYATQRTSAHERGLIDISGGIVGRFDIESGKISKVLFGDRGSEKAAGRRTPFELTSDETVNMTSGGNRIFGIRCDCGGGGWFDLKSGKGGRLPGVNLPRSTDMLPCGNTMAVSGRYIAYVKLNYVVCVRGQ